MLAELDQIKFERIETDITQAHAIRLNGAVLSDEGIYLCKVECYGQNGYSVDVDQVEITIIGEYSAVVTIHSNWCILCYIARGCNTNNNWM